MNSFLRISAQALLHSLQVGVVVHDASTKIVYANPKALEIMRLTEDQAMGRDAIDSSWHFLAADKSPLAFDLYPVNQVIGNGAPLEGFIVGVVDSSSDLITWVTCNAYPEFDDQGQIEKVIVNFVDITDKKEYIPFEDIVENTSDIVVVTEAAPVDGIGPRIVYVNKAFTELTGYDKEEVIGKTPRILQGPDTSPETRALIKEKLIKKEPVRVQILNYSKKGLPYWLDMNLSPMKNKFDEVNFFVAIERDVTEQKVRETALKKLATKDPLTDLNNRRGFYESVNSLLSTAVSSGSMITVAMIDVDFFKSINDRFGHDAGDVVLKNIAAILKDSFRQNDIVGRLGGEEFAVVLMGGDHDISLQLMDRLRIKISEHVQTVSGVDITVSVSIGMVTSETNGYELKSLMDAADKMLYQAKESGRNRVEAYLKAN